VFVTSAVLGLESRGGGFNDVFQSEPLEEEEVGSMSWL
jgi:hypothetical protein